MGPRINFVNLKQGTEKLDMFLSRMYLIPKSHWEKQWKVYLADSIILHTMTTAANISPYLHHQANAVTHFNLLVLIVGTLVHPPQAVPLVACTCHGCGTCNNTKII